MEVVPGGNKGWSYQRVTVAPKHEQHFSLIKDFVNPKRNSCKTFESLHLKFSKSHFHEECLLYNGSTFK